MKITWRTLTGRMAFTTLAAFRFTWAMALLLALFASVCLAGAAAEKIGTRPYELDWAGRTNDHCAPLIDFEDLSGWRVETRGAIAAFERSREQQLWNRYVGKLTYRATNTTPELRLLPPQPIPIDRSFDAVSLWCFGNNWGYSPDPQTPQVGISALFSDPAGKDFAVAFHRVDWTEWHLLHRRLTPEQIERVKRGASFKGFLLANGKNTRDRMLYLDNFAVFTEQFPPLQFEPRPERGIPMLPGQSAGANTGPGKLPFPTRAETILPSNLTTDFRTVLAQEGDSFLLTYAGGDSLVQYRLTPKTGTWSDLDVTWRPTAGPRAAASTLPEARFRPCVAGGVYLSTPKGSVAPEKAEHRGTRQVGETVESRWRLSAGEVAVEVTYVFRIWNKSLVIDVLAPGGHVAEVRYGHAQGLDHPRLVTNPFYPADGGRPAVVISGLEDTPLFLTGNTDWYLSNGSTPWAANAVSTEGVLYNGGTRYTPLVTGKRTDCFERFFLTVSPRYEEVLPTIANPPSSWRQVTGTRLWRAHGASNRERDKRYWEDVHRYGLTQMVVTDHETMWRDGGESFTFRTKAAPGKGGDAGAIDYARFVQDKLGFVYGPYNNFTDFAPVNEFWNFDMVSRSPDNQLQTAWMRCYAPKPARAIEYCARLAPQIQQKFQFSTAYCDVHTAVAPWHRVDYDVRVPGAGTFAAVFYSYGEIMLHQKRAWAGPVYSEGNYHSFYMGLTDGNYGQDQSYRPAENPWLVDFDLRKMHDLGCNFGMGSPDMFYASAPQPRATPAEREAWLDRFLAATVAFGHPGFLVMEGGMGNALRSYYMLQQLHSHYCLTNAVEIRYAGADGQLLDTSRALGNGSYQRSQVVTRYADGTVTAANGSKTERLRVTAYGRKLDLPPNGYAGWTEDGTIDVLSGDVEGHRSDCAATPAYLYVDGRGAFTRFAKAAGNGAGVCRRLGDGDYEVILLADAECGFAVNAASAVALDKARATLGPAPLRTARGLTYVVPVPGAFSYLLRRNPAAPPTALRTSRDVVVPGERVKVEGAQTHEIVIPLDAKPGQRLWRELEAGWIDFTVVPLAQLNFQLDGNTLLLRLTSHRADPAAFELKAAGRTKQLRLEPRRETIVPIELDAPVENSTEKVLVELRSGAMALSRDIGLRATRQHTALAPVPSKWAGGICVRGGAETYDFGASGAAVHAQAIECGGVRKTGIFMHPPYMSGVGYSFALLEPVLVPTNPPAAFRASVGKQDGSDPGDGILYQVAVVNENGRQTIAATAHVTQHAWQPIEANLTPWAGQRVRLKLISDVGTHDNSGGDWACWSELRLESLAPLLSRWITAPTN